MCHDRTVSTAPGAPGATLRPRDRAATAPRAARCVWIGGRARANSAYLLAITVLEWFSGLSYQNYFYQLMFLAHLVLGLLLVVPFLGFCVAHVRNTANRPNWRAIRVGWLLFFVSLALLLSGVALMRVEGFDLKQPALRLAAYWTHILTPVLVVWLYVLHRLSGTRIRWRVGLAWAGAVAVVVAAMVALHATDPRKWSVVGPWRASSTSRRPRRRPRAAISSPRRR